MAEVLRLVLAVEVSVAVGVLVFTVTEDVVTWLFDRHIRAVRERTARLNPVSEG